MNDLSNYPAPSEFRVYEERARVLRARAVANAGRWTWQHLAGVIRGR